MINIPNLLAILCVFFLLTLFSYGQLVITYNVKIDTINDFFDKVNWVQIVLYSIMIFIWLIIIKDYRKKICYYLYKYRYLSAVFIFILCVIFELNGSSIGMWDNYLPQSSSTDNSILFGTSRAIRSDEWATYTPMILSQYLNKPNAFAYINEIIRGQMTDSFSVYGQPIMSLLMIFRPFQIGFLFLSQAKGLSFFWCGRIITLFMVTFETTMIITKKNKNLSVLSAFLITFAPVVQWWFAINGFVEILVFGQLAILVIYKYMNTTNYKYRIMYAFILSICIGGYFFALYPAWMVPFAYAFLAMLIWIIIENYKNFKFKINRDIPIIVACIFIVLVGVIYFYIKSKDTIGIVSNTVYPGARTNNGGEYFLKMWQYPVNIFYQAIDKNLFTNVCELSTFFDFFPIGILLAIYAIFKQKKKDSLLISLLCVQSLLVLYSSISLPSIISKITFLSLSTANRTNTAIGFINIIILLRSMAIIKFKVNKKIALILSIIMAAIVNVLANSQLNGYMNVGMRIAVFLLVFTTFFIIFIELDNNKKERITILGVIIAISFGIFVNPIRVGTDNIYNNKLIREVEKITSDDSGLWIIEGDIPSNMLLFAGAPTINSTNVYPDLERWRSIDNGVNEDIYNRYAHITINLKNDDYESSFELTSADAFTIDMSVNDILKLNAKYILSTKDLSQYSNENIQFKVKDKIGQYIIYEIH